MRTPFLLSVALASVTLSAATATGCYNVAGDCNLFDCGSGGGGSTGTNTAGGGTGGTTIPDGCVPRDASGPVADGCGIFVGSIGNDENAGTKGNPVQTLQNAIAKAKEGEGRVYACAEIFTESFTVDADVTIFGGLDCM